VTTYLPDFHMAQERFSDITVRQLLSHTAGIAGGEPYDGRPGRRCDLVFDRRHLLLQERDLVHQRAQLEVGHAGEFGQALGVARGGLERASAWLRPKRPRLVCSSRTTSSVRSASANSAALGGLAQ
jgi:CubicO group peptidase (beta-lactamase class C family)